MEAERLIQHLRIRQEGVGDNAQLAAAVQMANRAADQRLGTGVERGRGSQALMQAGDDKRQEGLPAVSAGAG